MSIGGYFELELNERDSPLHKEAIDLNTGRNCLEYILREKKFKLVYIPYYTCDVILEPFKKTSTKYIFYHINEALEPEIELPINKNEAILYTNYFGIKDNFIHSLFSECNIIIDNSQALFTNPNPSFDTFYSPRKFVGLPDGGFLYTNIKSEIIYEQDFSFSRISHLIKRIDESAESGYHDFKKNDAMLSKEDIKRMSVLTKKLFSSIDFENVKNKRVENFELLNLHLKSLNKISFSQNSFACPMVYPLLSDIPGLRQRLLENKIYVAQYWPNVLKWCSTKDLEYYLCTNIIPLPIDQRYCTKEMNKIISIILEN